MSKSKLIDAVASKAGLSKTEAEAAVQATLDTIVDLTKSDGQLRLIGFGTFAYKLSAARTGRNPATGETLHIAEKQVFKFKPSKGL